MWVIAAVTLREIEIKDQKPWVAESNPRSLSPPNPRFAWLVAVAGLEPTGDPRR